ncbi:hypothetical protein Bca52824_010445 [Brassica carinata]|uniref:Uncharacterized protein n=1 Tax=Brassica carinata TaxID=52824 RepID=A0A8X8BB90_BRACI|nr:hypothetical protein Bca52824_010445 [Brassica carinata]
MSEERSNSRKLNCQMQYLLLSGPQVGRFLLVGEREAELDHLEQVDVRSQRLVVIFGVGFECSDRSANDPGNSVSIATKGK